MLIPDLELTITRDAAGGTTTATLRVDLPGRRADLAEDVPITISNEGLRAMSMLPDSYAIALSGMVFVPALREAWQRALGYTEGASARLRVRLNLKGDDGLHAIRWELLRDPISQTPLAYREQVSFSRYLGSNHMGAIQAASKPQLHAVIAVSDAAGFGMATVDVADEVQRAVTGLGIIPATILDGQKGRPSATLPALADALRSEAHILYLVCHGSLVDGKPYVYLKRQPGESDRPTPGADLVRQIADLARRPLLIVLASCQGAGDNYQTLATIGPQLARTGVGAVIAMQGDVSMDLVAALTPRLFTELGRDGQIDRALASARAALPTDQFWWQPTLWMALRDGALWQGENDDYPQLIKQERLNRERMLKRVNDIWVEGVLKKSIHSEVLMDIEFKYSHNAVNLPWEMIVVRPDKTESLIPPGITISDIFDKHDGELLILGAPGSGKTTMLLILTQALIKRSEDENYWRIPVVFNLSSWAEEQLPLDKWLITELNMRYGIPHSMATKWIQEDRCIMPLLDGLDEVRKDCRRACIEAINEFQRSDYGFVRMAVCCRLKDYHESEILLKFSIAVVIQPLTKKSINIYLDKGGIRFFTLRKALQDNAVLQELAETPLMLSIMALAYRRDDEILVEDSAEKQRRHLFALYVDSMLERRRNRKSYSNQQVIHWLSWLAHQMARYSQTIFFIEKLQPNYLDDLQELFKYLHGILVGMSDGLWIAIPLLFFGVSIGIRPDLIIGIIVGFLLIILSSGIFSIQMNRKALGKASFHVGITAGRSLSTLLFLALATLSTEYQRYSNSSLITSPSFFIGLTLSVFVNIVVCVFSLHSLLKSNQRQREEFFYVKIIEHPRRKNLISICVGTLRNPIMAFRTASKTLLISHIKVLSYNQYGFDFLDEIRETQAPNEGVWSSLQGSLLIGLLIAVFDTTIVIMTSLLLQCFYSIIITKTRFGVVFSYMISVPINGYDLKEIIWKAIIAVGLPIGIVICSRQGGFTFILHIILRIMLFLQHAIPGNYVRFLDFCAECIILRKVGGGYIFIHRYLLEYFAEYYNESKNKNQ